MSAKERLDGLLALASEGRYGALADALADILIDWPEDFPEAMRDPVTALLVRTAREADGDTRQRLAARIGGHGELPLNLFVDLYLEAPAPVRRETLMRAELDVSDGDETAPVDVATLLSAARQEGSFDFASAMGAAFHIPRRIAEMVLADGSGEALAVLCRGAGVDRATFTALALLRCAEGVSLTAFDSVPDHAARRIAGHWRAQAEQPHAEHYQAAE